MMVIIPCSFSMPVTASATCGREAAPADGFSRTIATGVGDPAQEWPAVPPLDVDAQLPTTWTDTLNLRRRRRLGEG